MYLEGYHILVNDGLKAIPAINLTGKGAKAKFFLKTSLSNEGHLY